ncbi:MAG TPA: malto-oligosyltrehalose trehalohydrolase, partial [Polyangiaceae bacterium]
MAMLYGASVQDGGVRFVVPAPAATTCAVRLFDAAGRPLETQPMEKKEGGIFSLFVPGLAPKSRYHYVLDGDEAGDPFARFLPDGVDAPASVESLDYVWRNPALGGRREGLSIYELHVGTFTPEGTYRAAAARLPELADVGVTAVELMPIAAFAGRRGWGYDGVRHFAPFAPYGTPEELAEFIDLAHDRGLRVFL